MRWKKKAAVQRVLSVLPAGNRVNQLLQSARSRSWHLGPALFEFQARLAVEHLRLALQYLPRPVSSLNAYEFGAGSALVLPLMFFALGVPSQTIIDQDVLLRPTLVRDAIDQIRRGGRPEFQFVRLPDAPVRGSRPRLISYLREWLGIDYRAPLDASRTALPAKSMDLITSNSTLEHVPSEDIQPLLAECRRLLKDDGVICFRIDYEDHYTIGDRTISEHNFLRFSGTEWKRFNSRLHFQNRLRHVDYLQTFRESGLTVIHVDTLEPSASALAELAEMPLDEQFRKYTLAELGTRKGTFVLRKA